MNPYEPWRGFQIDTQFNTDPLGRAANVDYLNFDYIESPYVPKDKVYLFPASLFPDYSRTPSPPIYAELVSEFGYDPLAVREVRASKFREQLAADMRALEMLRDYERLLFPPHVVVINSD